MQTKEKRSFEDQKISPADATEKMRQTLTRQMEDLQKTKVGTLEDGRAKNREIRKIRETIKKLTEPALDSNIIQVKNFDASPKVIEGLKTKRDSLVQDKSAEEKQPWWKRALSFFGKKEEYSKTNLELMRTRREIKNATKAQSNVAYEIAKKVKTANKERLANVVPEMFNQNATAQTTPELGTVEDETLEMEKKF